MTVFCYYDKDNKRRPYWFKTGEGAISFNYSEKRAFDYIEFLRDINIHVIMM